MLHPPKRHVYLEVLIEKKAFRFSKRALRAGTAHNNIKIRPGNYARTLNMPESAKTYPKVGKYA